VNEIEQLKALYPGLSPDEISLAKENLDRYLSLAWEILEDQRMAALPFLAEPPSLGTMQGKVDSQTN
jgi:hypothetical protein